jgi:hypothetical protein
MWRASSAVRQVIRLSQPVFGVIVVLGRHRYAFPRLVGGVLVQKSRFIVLSIPAPGDVEEVGEDAIGWILVSSNNRPLGRGGTTFASSQACLDAVNNLRRDHERATCSALAESNGQWAWRVDVDGHTVAVSTRTYFRHHECDYNLRRFLEAVPSADVADGIRVVQSGRRRSR